MPAVKFSDTECIKALDSLNQGLDLAQHWTLVNGKLCKTFTFKSFVRAFGWMSQIAIVAEKMNHHPEWHNVYNRVTIELVTHDVEGISDYDFTLASKMERFYS